MVSQVSRITLFSRTLFFSLSAMICLSPNMYANEYALEKQDILNKQHHSVGVLYKGAKLKKQGNAYVLSGWAMDGNEYIVFYSETQRIKLARLQEEFISSLKVNKTLEDKYGVMWKQVDLTLWLEDKSKLTVMPEKLWVEEEELYQRCGSCHKSYPAHEYTANQWPPIVKTMKDNAGLSKKESKAMSVYLQYESIKEK